MNNLLIAVKPEINKLKQKIKKINPEKTFVFGLNNENKLKALIELEELANLNADLIALEDELNETISTAIAMQKMSSFISFEEWDFHLIHALMPEEKIRVELRKNIRKKKSIVFSAFKPRNERNPFGSKTLSALIEEKKPLLFVFPGKEYFENALNETVIVSVPEKTFLLLKLGNEIKISEIK